MCIIMFIIHQLKIKLLVSKQIIIMKIIFQPVSASSRSNESTMNGGCTSVASTSNSSVMPQTHSSYNSYNVMTNTNSPAKSHTRLEHTSAYPTFSNSFNDNPIVSSTRYTRPPNELTFSSLADTSALKPSRSSPDLSKLANGFGGLLNEDDGAKFEMMTNRPPSGSVTAGGRVSTSRPSSGTGLPKQIISQVI